MPCHLDNFLRVSAGIVKNAITNSITGISIMSDELIPAICVLLGTGKGETVEATPLTKTKFKIFAPITLPSESAPCPLTIDVMAVTSSGNDVPMATNVSAITFS